MIFERNILIFILYAKVLIFSCMTKSYASNLIEVESAVIRCDESEGTNFEDSNAHSWDKTRSAILAQNDDAKVVEWKPDSHQNKIGPHDPNSALKMISKNNVDLKLSQFRNCSHQALISFKITHNSSQSALEDGALIKIDHMFEEFIGKPVRLGNPIAVKIQQGPLFNIYPLKYLTTVNAAAYEEVINNENRKNFSGCISDDEDAEPTCGFALNEKGETIVKSKGFCCECKAQTLHQVRGGHKCGKNIPKSAHCMRLSEYWYGVYELGQPEIFHQVYIQVYESAENDTTGKIQWRKLGKGEKIIKIDSHNVTHYKEGDELSINYRKVVPSAKTFNPLNSNLNFLLIPKPYFKKPKNEKENTNDDTLTNGGNEIYIKKDSLKNSSSKTVEEVAKIKIPKQFKDPITENILLVPKKQLGVNCDKVGVGYEAFSSQKSPCSENKGSCLKNQPFDLWNVDSNKANFRLKHFGRTHVEAPFKMIKNSICMVLEYESEASGYIDIQLPIDNLQVVRPGFNAEIISITTDSSSLEGKLMIEIANKELVPAYFSVYILKCNNENISFKKSIKSKIIGPNRMQRYQLDLNYAIEIQQRIICSVGVVNQNNDLIAVREVSLSPRDTCICYLGCECSCLKEAGTMECTMISDDDIRAAGFTT